MIKKRRISLEEEKAFNEKLWSDIMQNLEDYKHDQSRIVAAIERLNKFDLELIKLNRRDLLG